jgi:DNA-binding transcriptional LysR family regulator
VSESIDIKSKRAAIALADELSYPRASEKLNISLAELKNLISALETKLYLYIFLQENETVELTEDGKFLIRVFREAVVAHDRKIADER